MRDLLRPTLFLILAIAFLLSQGCAPKQGAKPEERWAPVLHDWVFPPMVKVCSTAPVTKDEVQWALDLWANHGAPELTAIDSHCLSKNEPWTVYVDQPTVEEYAAHWTEHTIGLTSVYRYAEGQPPVAADLHLVTGDRRVLLHEVGHLWIPAHYPGKEHVLSEWLGDFAYSFEGVDKVFK